ncbi:RNA/RNP complex-1-interacting phosphatase isoform X1 [Atheta coriaria]|uniref:RNA/RNP complex-1-interacting phosphatase isoform X1 n=1 Tax=Dalotia coriaria TaxID=877792 RepID=UPI0031F42867
MTGKRGVPKGWLDFTNLGKRLPGTSFVPFKVPLKQAICNNLPNDQWFTPKDVLEQLPQLKLVINLTNAGHGRYYQFKDFVDQGVKVEQIMCEGRGTLPPAQKLHRFYNIVDDFLRQGEGHNEDLIGVHCTHGLNRTGYFICKYLIHKMNMAPDAAIELFESSRGHAIERDQYTTNLREISCVETGSDTRRYQPKSKPTSSYDSIEYNERPSRSSYTRESVANWREADHYYPDHQSYSRSYKQAGRYNAHPYSRPAQESYYQDRNQGRSYNSRSKSRYNSDRRRNSPQRPRFSRH